MYWKITKEIYILAHTSETDMNELIKQMLDLLYQKRDGIDHEEFDCLVGLVRDGYINSFEELAEYGVAK